ncbi:hypothetical protein H9P43_002952 [Blastocladiella emersonii ATCC 22665]|nr:hypothetical protein H9P43_002952 [Blastocladiella emersonii ATCC 22665]
MTNVAPPAGTRIAPSERDAITCFGMLGQLLLLLLQGKGSAALKLARATLPAEETRAVVAQVAFGKLNACQWDDALALLKKVRLEPQYLLHTADRDHSRYGRENKEIAAFLTEVKAPESFEAIVNLAMHKLCGGQPSSLDSAWVASLRASLDERVDRFLLSYLDAWWSTSDAVDPTVEVARLHLLLKLDRGMQERLADDVAARGHPFAESLVSQCAGDTRRELDLWQSLLDSTPPATATAAPGGKPRWVSARGVAQLLADLGYAADHASDIQWLLARDRAFASHNSNGPRGVLVPAYLAEGDSVGIWLSKYRAAIIAFYVFVSDFFAATWLLAFLTSVAGLGGEDPVGKYVNGVGDFASAHRVCGTEEVPFEVVVDAPLKMDRRDAYRSLFMPFAAKDMDVVDFRAIANVLPGDWAPKRVALLLMHELAKPIILAAAQEQPGPVTPPASCFAFGCAVDSFVATHAGLQF